MATCPIHQAPCRPSTASAGDPSPALMDRPMNTQNPIGITPGPLSRRQVREIDSIAIEQFGLSGLVLMENAGRGAAEVIDRRYPTGDIVILCGKGNNGGDGYVIARHLDLRGRTVGIVSLVDPHELRGDAAANHQVAVLSELPIQWALDATTVARAVRSASVIVDCLLGTGAEGPPREPMATAIRIANETNATRVAIDLPSGLDCDTGIASEPTFRADLTVTFVALKIGFLHPEAAGSIGEVEVVPIGVPRRLLRMFADAKSDPESD